MSLDFGPDRGAQPYPPPPPRPYAPPARREPFGAGQVLSDTISVYVANLVPFTVLTGIVLSPAIGATVLFAAMAQGSEDTAVALGEGIGGLLRIVLQPLATGAVTYGVVQQVRGHHPPLGDCISVGLSRLLSVFAVGLLSGLIIVLGLFAFCIPGLIFMAMYYVAVPAAVIEQPGVMASLRRSSDLTDGYRWSIFGLAIIVGLLGGAAGAFAEMLGVAAGPLIGAILSAVAECVATAFGATAAAVAYYRLRLTKEGVDADQLAQIFE